MAIRPNRKTNLIHTREKMLQKVRPVGKQSGEPDDEVVFQPKKENAKMDKKGFLSKSVVHVQRRKARCAKGKETVFFCRLTQDT